MITLLLWWRTIDIHSRDIRHTMYEGEPFTRTRHKQYRDHRYQRTKAFLWRENSEDSYIAKYEGKLQNNKLVILLFYFVSLDKNLHFFLCHKKASVLWYQSINRDIGCVACVWIFLVIVRTCLTAIRIPTGFQKEIEGNVWF